MGIPTEQGDIQSEYVIVYFNRSIGQITLWALSDINLNVQWDLGYLSWILKILCLDMPDIQDLARQDV